MANTNNNKKITKKQEIVIIVTVSLLPWIIFPVWVLCNAFVRISNVQISEWEPSAIYSDDDIESAIQAAKFEFMLGALELNGFEDCTLTELSYAGDDYAERNHERALNRNADEAIVILAEFDAGSSSGCFDRNSTYSDFQFILVREADESWKVIDQGY